MEQVINDLIERLKLEIAKTPTGELHDLLCDVNKIICSLDDRNIKKLNNKVSYSDFIERFNLITGKKIRVPDAKFKRQLNARLRDGFSIDEIFEAVKNCVADKYHVENPKFLTPEFITRSDKLQKYLNIGITHKSKVEEIQSGL